MALQTENMSYEELKEVVDGLACRSISQLVVPQVPPGPFDLTCFPMTTMEKVDNAGVPGDIDYFAFPEKLKPVLIKRFTYGEVLKLRFMMSNPKNGRKFCSIAWKIWEGYELTSQAVRKSGAKSSIPLEDKEDTEIDEGFEHILQHAPRSSCEVAQLQWQTKGLWSTQSLVGFLLLSARPFVTSPQMERLPGKSSTGPFLSFQSIFKLEHIWDRSPLYPSRFFAPRTRFKSHGRFFFATRLWAWWTRSLWQWRLSWT